MIRTKTNTKRQKTNLFQNKDRIMLIKRDYKKANKNPKRIKILNKKIFKK